MVSSKEILIFAAIGAGLILVASKGKASQAVGEAAGVTAANVTTGTISSFTQKGLTNVTTAPYEWAQSYKHYIPIVDDVAFYFARPDLRGKLTARQYEQKYLGF